MLHCLRSGSILFPSLYVSLCLSLCLSIYALLSLSLSLSLSLPPSLSPCRSSPLYPLLSLSLSLSPSLSLPLSLSLSLPVNMRQSFFFRCHFQILKTFVQCCCSSILFINSHGFLFSSSSYCSHFEDITTVSFRSKKIIGLFRFVLILNVITFSTKKKKILQAFYTTYCNQLKIHVDRQDILSCHVYCTYYIRQVSIITSCFYLYIQNIESFTL